MKCPKCKNTDKFKSRTNYPFGVGKKTNRKKTKGVTTIICLRCGKLLVKQNG